MKTLKPFGPTLGKGKLSKNIIKIINTEVDKISVNKKNDYSSKLASQIKNEIKISNSFIKKNLNKEIIQYIKKYLTKSQSKKINEVKIINLWIVRQFKNEYNPIHYHGGQLSGVGYLKIPKKMTENRLLLDSLADPFILFKNWFDSASEKELYDPNAMSLSTISENLK